MLVPNSRGHRPAAVATNSMNASKRVEPGPTHGAALVFASSVDSTSCEWHGWPGNRRQSILRTMRNRSEPSWSLQRSAPPCRAGPNTRGGTCATISTWAAATLLLGTAPVSLAEPMEPRGPAVFHISADPPLELTAYDRHSLQESCIEKLPGLIAQLEPSPAHAGDYEAHVHVLSAEQITEHLERSPQAETMLGRAHSTIQHGLDFWGQVLTQPAQFQFLVMTGPPGTEAELAGYPTDPRVLIQVYRKRGRRLQGKVEILFEDHEPHSFELAVDQIRVAQFTRSAQWGVDDRGRAASRFVRTPIWWSVDRISPIAALAGSGPALETLRLQLSPYTDDCKRRLFEADEKQHGRVDIHRIERHLWRLDTAEAAVVNAVGSVWLTALAREHGHRLTPSELATMVDMHAAGVAELLAHYPPTQKGMTRLLAAYTGDPTAIVNRLGWVLDP